MFPNPFKEQIQISYTMTAAGTISVEFFDLLGRSVKVVQESHEQPGVYHTQLQAQDLPAGTFYYKAIYGNRYLH